MHNLARHEDRRRATRRTAELAARIRFPAGVFVPATVRDISPSGARLELKADAILPLRFRLQIPGDVFECECEIRHHKGREVGVEFRSNRAEAMARYS